MQSSGEAGVIVVSFGSMVTNLTTERAEVIAAAFGRMQQKVGVVPTARRAAHGRYRPLMRLLDDVVNSIFWFVLRSSGDTAEQLHKHCQRIPNS